MRDQINNQLREKWLRLNKESREFLYSNLKAIVSGDPIAVATYDALVKAADAAFANIK